MYSDTVTVFNRRQNRKAVKWYPTILHNCNLNLDRAAMVAQYGEGAADNALLNVSLPTVKPYLPPKEWAAVENPEAAITFTAGEKFDFFWAGEWPDEKPVDDGDYTEGFYNYMNKQHDYVFAVTSVNGPFSVIPHLEVVGK
jgi:hypothetical protein